MQGENKKDLSRFIYRTPKSEVESIKRAIVYKLIFAVGCDPREAKPNHWMAAVQYVVRDLVTENWLQTQRSHFDAKNRMVYYLSMEYLMGRSFSNAMIAEGIYETMEQAICELGLDFAEVVSEEQDPGLGNGGLGRLAACFLDSMATLAIPAMGYGIRYEYGMFKQEIVGGEQQEQPDNWLEGGTPWLFMRPNKSFQINFGGRVFYEGRRARWVEEEHILARAHDQVIPGYGGKTANTLRLWSASASDMFNLSDFNKGDYFAAMEQRNTSENVSRVLYPDDSTMVGRELRLRQEYFLVSASIQDLLIRQLEVHGSLEGLERHIAIHLNDTHPALAIAELMRILIDDYDWQWVAAWQSAQAIFSYTNHTLMSEALETWSVDTLGRILPRHLGIIFEINEWFLALVRERFPNDEDLVRRVSLIDEHNGRRVRMAWLSVVGSHKVNGVAKIHSDLMVKSIFADFAKIFPERFTNVTNGVTPRRWIAVANRPLAQLLDDRMGGQWRTDLQQLSSLMRWQEDADFIEAVASVKQHNKERLAQYIEATVGVKVSTQALFDVQIKRIHEYKRQSLNIMHIVHRYFQILQNPHSDWVPRVFVFAGKAASAYKAAKQIIRLINDVAQVVNNDPRIGDLMKVVFLPNYSVSVAQIIIPGTDLSEQISLAGTEASGTGNMKFALNGALTIGTLDGANVEMLHYIGRENIFIFGHTVEEVEALRQQGYLPMKWLEDDADLRAVVEQVSMGRFSPNEPCRHQETLQPLIDYYQSFADFRAYIQAQERVDECYRDKTRWTKMAIANIAHMGYFSSDRAIMEYAHNIWQTQSCPDVGVLFDSDDETQSYIQ